MDGSAFRSAYKALHTGAPAYLGHLARMVSPRNLFTSHSWSACLRPSADNPFNHVPGLAQVQRFRGDDEGAAERLFNVSLVGVVGLDMRYAHPAPTSLVPAARNAVVAVYGGGSTVALFQVLWMSDNAR